MCRRDEGGHSRGETESFGLVAEAGRVGDFGILQRLTQVLGATGVECFGYHGIAY